jgi:Putative Actinobacterial Holin-X, holin superfamily III
MAQPYPSDQQTITLDHGPDAAAGTDAEDRSLGELVKEITTDLTTLMRKEIDLAKAEMKEEAIKAGKGAGIIGGGAFAGYLAAVVLTFAAVFGLSYVIGMALSAVAVGVVLAIVALVLIKRGQAKLRTVEPKPERTVETLKEDAQWARHPTS